MLIKHSRIPLQHLLTIGILPSFLKKSVYRLKGYKIGKNVSLGIGSVIQGKQVEIGNNTKIGLFTIIRGRSIKIGRFVTIGSTSIIDTERIEIDDDARINEQVFVGGISTPRSLFKLGKRTIIMQMSFINPTEPVVIGDDTGIGGHCLLFTHGSWLSQLDGFPVTFAPITLGKNVWLPWRVFIMPGTEIGDNVVIGANSLVRNKIQSNCLIAGSPAQIIRDSYPPEISKLKKDTIFENIFIDFHEYLVYHGFVLNKEQIENGYTLNVKRNNRNHVIFYHNSPSNQTPNSSDNLLIINHNEIAGNSNFNMILNLQAKTRKGSSDIGEEFTKFLSRYGIRFSRLD